FPARAVRERQAESDTSRMCATLAHLLAQSAQQCVRREDQSLRIRHDVVDEIDRRVRLLGRHSQEETSFIDATRKLPPVHRLRTETHLDGFALLRSQLAARRNAD